MTRQNEHKKARQTTHKRLRLLLMLPVILAVWIVGWSLYWWGSRRKRKQTLTFATGTCINYLKVNGEGNDSE